MRSLSFTLSATVLAGVSAFLAFGAGPSLAGGPGPTTVLEDFEDPEDLGPVNRLAIGEGRARARLDGGEIGVRGLGHLYVSFPHAWLFDPRRNGHIRWKLPANEVSFFANSIDGFGLVILIDRWFRIAKVIRVEPTEFPTQFRVRSKVGIRRAFIFHFGTILAIDDLEFTVN